MHVLQVVVLLLGVWAVGLPITLGVLKRETPSGALTLGLSFVAGNLVLLGLGTAVVVLGRTALLLPFWYALSAMGALVLIAMLATHIAKFRFGWRDLAVVIAALLIFAPVCFWGSTQAGNGTDAKAMWLFRAKAVVVGESALNAHYSDDAFLYSHRDYPIGFSAGLALFMQLQPEPSEHLAAPYATSFLLAAMLVVGGLLIQLLPSSRVAPVLAVVAFGAAPALQSQASTFYADVPLAAVFCAALACLVLLLEATSGEQKRAWFFMSALTAASALLIKNEGLPMFALVVLGGLVLVGPRSVRALIRLVIAPVVFAIPFAAWYWFKTKYHIRGFTLVPPYSDQAVLQPLNHRAWIVWHAIAPNIVNFSYWGWSLLPVILGGAGAAVANFTTTRKARLLVPCAVLAGQAASYVGVYLLSHYEISWLVATSIDRVLVQLYPATWVVAVWYVAYSVRLWSAQNRTT